MGQQLTLLGLGVVGGGVARACAVPGAAWSVRKALVRDASKARDLPIGSGVLTTDPEEALAGDGPVIEVLGGEQPAADLIAAALERGRPVATANKVAIAAHGPRLFALARERGVGLGIEACVGGGVPVIAALRQLRGGQPLTAIGGVVNGTTNAILSGIEAGQTYAEALAAAQAAGFAEPDPSADVDGHDPAAKLAILIALAFGLRVEAGAIPRRPLADISPADLSWAAQRGARVKYLARAVLGNDGQLYAAVEPTALPAGDPLASPVGSGNAIRAEGPLIGATTLTGPGAGPAPTAGALLGDVALAVAGKTVHDYPAPDAPFVSVCAPVGRWIVRLPAGIDPAALAYDAQWSDDGGDKVGVIAQVVGAELAPAVRAAGGTCFRWEAGD
ncbi:MAG: homoserine dehydrogenase [Chloroflexia bacterium]